MKMKLIFFSVVSLVVLAAGETLAQGGRRVPEFSQRQEYVSLDSTMPFDRAIAALSEVSKRFSGKIIIDVQERISPIGVSIRGLHWRDALDVIAEANSLRIIERADYIEVKSLREGPAGGAAAGKAPVSIETREVLISTIFFSLDLDKSIAYGIDWSFSWFKSPDSVGATLTTGTVGTGALNVQYTRPYKFGDIASTVRLFSQNGLGEIISSPRIIVRSGEKGKVQVGQDISVTDRTFSSSGVTTSVRQIPTGTIVDVTPDVIKEGDIEYVSLDLSIDRSTALTTGDAPTIDRNNTSTKLLLIDGEEAFLSGLYFNEVDITRTGIPLLKDLPPWFFGLRYLFGSDSRRTIRRELAILIRADVLPTLKERAGRKTKENIIEMMRNRFNDDVQRLKMNKDYDE